MGDNRADEALSTIPPRPVRFPFTLGLLTILVLCSVVLVVTGVAMFALDTAPVLVRGLAIISGVGLTGWFGWVMSRGAGRRTPVITASTPMHVTCVAAFGLPMGFSLFQLLTVDRSPVTIAMFAASAIGLAACLVVFVRDADLLDVPIEVVVLPSATGEAPTEGESAQVPAATEPVAPVHRFSDVDGEEVSDEALHPTSVEQVAVAQRVGAPDTASPDGFAAPDTVSPAPRRRAMVVDEDDEPVAPPRRAARRAALED